MRNDNIPHSTEDKGWWTKYGEQLELLFCSDVAPRLGLKAVINPEKAKNKFAPDLIVNGIIADLKSQHTPFFTALRYQKDPGRTVTFNDKDLLRYSQKYPNLEIYFYVRWDRTEWDRYSVQFLHGLWRTNVQQINKLIQSNKAPSHPYQRRKDDTSGHAKESFLLTLDDLELVGLLD